MYLQRAEQHDKGYSSEALHFDSLHSDGFGKFKLQMRSTRCTSDTLGPVKMGNNVVVFEENSGQRIYHTDGIVTQLTTSQVTVSLDEHYSFAAASTLYLAPKTNLVSRHLLYI